MVCAGNAGTLLNAAIRGGPSKGSKPIASLKNGARVDTISGQPVYDAVPRTAGWIASSLVDLIGKNAPGPEQKKRMELQ